MSDVIEFRKEGDVGVITINNPPANALSFAAVSYTHLTLPTIYSV